MARNIYFPISSQLLLAAPAEVLLNYNNNVWTQTEDKADNSSHPPFANAIRTADLSNAVFVFR